MSVHSADEWIRTDLPSIREDVQRLGWKGAAEYQVKLAADRAAAGDDRWDFTAAEMLGVLWEEVRPD